MLITDDSPPCLPQEEMPNNKKSKVAICEIFSTLAILSCLFFEFHGGFVG